MRSFYRLYYLAGLNVSGFKSGQEELRVSDGDLRSFDYFVGRHCESNSYYFKLMMGRIWFFSIYQLYT